MHAPPVTSSRSGIDFGVPLILLLAALTALDAMAIDMYLPAFPAVAEAFAAAPGEVQHTLSVFLVGLALGQGLYGPLLDRYGRRLPLLVGTLVFVAGSVMAALAPSLPWLLAARFLQALGAAAGLVAPRAIVTDVCNLATSARIFSLLMQVMMIAPIVAPLLGGYLLAHGGWRFIFWTLAAVALACAVSIVRIVPETLAPARRVPLHAGSIVRAYLRQCRNGPFMAYTLSGGFVLGALFVYISGSPFVVITHFGLSPTQFSYFFAANAVGLVVAGQLNNMLLKRLSGQRVLFIGLVVHTLAAATLALLGWRLPSMGAMLYLPLLGLSIWALGLTFGNLAAITMAHAGPQAGVASALMGLLQYLLGAAVGLASSLATPGLVPLPAVIALCGVLALLACRAGPAETATDTPVAS